MHSVNLLYNTPMHVIKKTAFIEAAEKYTKRAVSFLDTHKALEKGNFQTPLEMQAVYPSLDNFEYKGHWYVIDIAGNKFRMIADIRFPPYHHCLYVKAILTHPEYDDLCKKAAKKGWKGEI